MNIRFFFTYLLSSFFALSSQAQVLKNGFLSPPQEARPRVWWHWMDGNITKEGIRKDLEWMHRAGIGGFHCFEASLGISSIVEQRLVFMSPEWQDAFRYAISLADSLNMETAIASCAGWSNTGGPWVKPEQAMKKLVWSEVRMRSEGRGARSKEVLSLPHPDSLMWYKDLYVLAIRLNEADKTMEEVGAALTTSTSSIQYTFPQPQTIKALSINDGQYRSIWAAQPAPVNKHLEASDDGITFRYVCDIPHGSISWQTIGIPPTTAKVFRVVFDNPMKNTPRLKLFTVSKINHIEEKAGYASPSDMMSFVTTATSEDFTLLSDIVDITDKMDAEGNLRWNAPKGNWRILRFGCTLTGKQNHPAPKEATGLEVTKMDKAAFSDFLTHYLDLYRGCALPDNLLIDSYEAGWETWCPTLPDEFERRRGYALLPWLPVLTGQIVESVERSEEFLFDWRTTIGELIDECMYQNAARIAKDYGMKTYFESHENGRLYLVDGMSAKSNADIPMAAMWTIIPDKKYDNSSQMMGESDIRESASVAHLYGKKFVAVESMTVNGSIGGAYSFYPGNLKPTVDLELANGANRIVIHESAHQPVDDKRPGLGLNIYGQWFNRHETWAEMARAWTDYIARSCFLLQQGQNVADVLYYYGEDDVVTSLFAHQPPAIPDGYNYDYLNKEALLELVSYDGNCFRTPNGATYRLLIIGKTCRHFSEKVLQKIEALKRQGAPIVDEKSVDLTSVISQSIPADFLADDMTDLRYVHRSTPEGEVYWVNNRRHEQRTVLASFRIDGRKPMIWHPDTGEMEEACYETKDGRTDVRMNLLPDDAVFVVFETLLLQKDESENFHGSRPTTAPEVTEIVSPWTVCFDPRWGGPVETTFPQLISYTDSPDDGIRYYSGTAIYYNKVRLTHSYLRKARVVLDLGRVGCMAEVSVNGIPCGVLWKAPYRVDITQALRKGWNTLEIRVANQWVNRIIGDCQPNCKQRYTFTPFDFYKADSPLLPAGLIGPVSLNRIRE